MSLSFRMISRSAGERARVIQRLERHARRESAVADDGHGTAVFAALAAAMAMPSAAVIEVSEWPDPEGVVFAFAPGRKGREAAVLLDRVQQLAASGQHLVRIGLVAHVPDQAVIGCIENVMQRDGELDRAETRGEMAAARADALDQELPQLVRPAR